MKAWRRESKTLEESSGSDCKLCMSVSSCQGTRPEMEDAELISRLDLPDHSIIGVFDGHGGDKAAKYAAEFFIPFLSTTDSYRRYTAAFREANSSSPFSVQSGGDSSSARKGAGATTTDMVALLGEALKETFLKLDQKLFSRQSRNPGDTSGTTACVVLISPSYILCANAGDSRCVLSTDGFAKALSVDHKPTDAQEITRIEKAGGKVHRGRVDGELAVARAIGDYKYKPKTSGKDFEGLDKVISTPSITTYARSNLDEFLVVACDGLWDVYSSTEALLQVSSLLLATGDTPSSTTTATENLIDLALANGSQDNITCAVCRFVK